METPQNIHSYRHVPQRPRCKPYFKKKGIAPSPKAAGAGSGSWNVPDLCAAYNWPTGLAGGGVIAIVELGGGWVQSDMDKFFASVGQPVPQITDISVDGTKNTPNPDPNGSDGEVALDLEVAAAAYFVATAGPPLFACTGRRISPKQCAPPQRMAATFAPSPGCG